MLRRRRLVYSAKDRLQFGCVSSVQMSVGAGEAAFKHLLLIPTHAVLVMITGQSGFAASAARAGWIHSRAEMMVLLSKPDPFSGIHQAELQRCR